MELASSFDPFKKGWQIVRETDDAWVMNFFNGYTIAGTTVRKRKVYGEIADALFGWLGSV